MPIRILTVLILVLTPLFPAHGGETPAPDGAKAYMVSPANGATVANPVEVVFGLKGMGVAPAGIEKAKTHSYDDKARTCIYGVVTALFDSMHIHSIEVDFLGKQKTDHITIIQIRPTGSKEQLRLKPSQSI